MENEWMIRDDQEIGYSFTVYHLPCRKRSWKKYLEDAGLCGGRKCVECEKPIPKYILFQWKLLLNN